MKNKRFNYLAISFILAMCLMTSVAVAQKPSNQNGRRALGECGR